MSQRIHQSQLKRSFINTTQQQQSTEVSSSLQEIISKIQQSITQASESIKHQLQQFQYQQLLNYKEDLFKTQDEFIKVRAERNEEVIRNKVLEEKRIVEEKFMKEMKRSMEMNAKYEEMKGFMKTINDQEAQLLMEINFLKKNLEKERQQGKILDAEIEELKVESQCQSNQFSKLNGQSQLFTDLVNKYDTKLVSQPSSSKCGKDSIKTVETPTNLNIKTEKRLKQKISNLKDYIQNIPLNLSFIENKLYQAMLRKQDQNKKDQERKKEKSINNDEQSQYEKGKNDEVKEQEKQQNFSTNKSDHNNSHKESQLNEDSSRVKAFKLPTLKQLDKTIKQKMKSLKQLHSSSKINTVNITKNPALQTGSQLKLSVLSKYPLQRSLVDKVSLLDQLPKSSDMIEQILSDPEVKQYLYKLMFG